VTVDRENVTYIYNSRENVVQIFHEITYTTGSWLDMDFYRKIKEYAKQWDQSYVKDEKSGKECIVVSFVAPEYDRGATKSGKIFFDLNSKLPVRMKMWKNRDFEGPPFMTVNEIIYNPQIPEGTFDFEIPEGAKVIEEGQK
jgi:outer membrane lipoprotein-sorting protein